jgi:hypothetical protein
MADKGQNRSAKDKEMAARLKREGDERWTGRCPICYALIRCALMYQHISAHSRGAI